MGELEHDEKRHQIIWRVSAEKAEEHMLGWRMLESNEILGFLPFDYYYIDSEVQFRYVYTSVCYSLDDYLKQKKLDFDFVILLCRELLKILDKGQEYLLDLNACPISPEWIFWNAHEHKIGICFLPGREGSIQKDFTTFVEEIMQYLDHSDRAAVELIYGLYDRVVSGSFLPEQILCYLGEFTESEQGVLLKGDETAVEYKAGALKPKQVKSEQIKSKKSDTDMIQEKSDGRCVLQLLTTGGIAKFAACLQWEAVREVCWQENAEFVIGREEGSALCIPLGEISSRHAVLLNEEEGVYVMDTASKNGTYVNGTKIPAYVKTLCQTDDIITFADISYKIQL